MLKLLRYSVLTISIAVACFLTGCIKIDPDNISAADLKLAREAVKTNLETMTTVDPAFDNITAMAVAIDRTHDFAKLRVTEREILEPLKLKLRLAGIKVLTIEDAVIQCSDIPLLQLSFITMKWRGDTVCTVETRMYDNAILLKDMSKKAHVCSWEGDSDIDVIPAFELRKTILEMSGKQVDQFLTAFLKEKGL